MMCVGGDKVMSNIRGEPIYRVSQGKGRLQIAVGLNSELPFEIVRGEPRGSGVTRQKYPSKGASIGGHRASAFGAGCVKTRAGQGCAKLFSQLPSCDMR